MRVRLSGTVALTALLALPLVVVAQQEQHPGKPVYDRWCAGCHGEDGKGSGDAAAFMLPRPRDFTQALYQVRTTSTGSLPTDADILHVIDEGMPGTAMPGWRRALTERERQNLVEYLKTFSPFFESDQPQLVEFGRATGVSDDVLAEGRDFYQRLECFKCHGQGGRGDGPSAPTQEDDNGFPIRPADLTQAWLFNGGGTVEDIFRRLRTGLDGTPMPSYSDAMDAGIATEAQLWSVAHYVKGLGGEAPAVREVVEAKRVETVPSAPDDSAWNEVDQFWIPLVGQIIVRPRWFAPAVTGVWVQAVHDGTDVALRISWNDRSRSPDPIWADWRRRVTEVMEPKEAPASAADSAAVPASPDGIAVWFPRSPPTGMERPYFYMGNARQPVYAWHWENGTGGREALGRGPGRLEPLAGAGNQLNTEAAFDQGQWRVVFRRPLAATDTENALSFPPGAPVPMAFFAWDGDNSETGTRGSLSTWYFLQLTEPTSATLYATPLIAVLLTAGLGVFAVGRAQRREREHSGS
jgi:cytochrome c oxidase cbb3-type subunit 2